MSGDGVVDKQEFDQVIQEKGNDLNQDQINIFTKKFQQDENSKVTYEGIAFFLIIWIIKINECINRIHGWCFGSLQNYQI